MNQKTLLICSLLVAFLIAGKASAQMVQYGKVVEMNSQGKPVSGVSVTVLSAHDCHPTASDAFGVFKLSFGEHQTGDVIHGLRAKKYGYEVVNIHVTRDGWTLTDRDTLRIVMATTEKLHEARMRYYDLLETAAVARYDTTMRVLDTHLASNTITLPEYQYWKLEAETELQRAYQNMEALADELAHTVEEGLEDPSEVVASRLEADETVLQAYTNFSVAFPMESLESQEGKAGLDSLQANDSLYEQIMVLQTYVNLFESDYTVSCAKYAKFCAYLGAIYQERGWDEPAKKYLNKALQMYEMLHLMEAVEVQDKIDIIKELLDNQ